MTTESVASIAPMSTFTPSHRGGSGSPLVCLHGFTDTWRTWDLVLPELERHHDVRAMDGAGFETAHIAGNSLGGYVALQLAERGRAESVVALAPAGGWAEDDESYKQTLQHFVTMQEQMKTAAPNAHRLLASRGGRRLATQFFTTNFEHIPVELSAHQMLGVTGCEVLRLVDFALHEGYTIVAEKISCPVRVVWGTEDRLLPWPATASRYRENWLPRADWIELEGVGHCPQLDVPLEAAQLIVGFTAS